MKKYIVFIVCILFLTGCDITYNIDIDKDSFKEDISAIENNYSNWSYTFSGMSLAEMNDYYLVKEIPYHYDDVYYPEAYVRVDGVSYYNTSDLSNNNQIGLKLNARFKTINGYSRSNALWTGLRNIDINDTENGFTINASGFKSFDEYDILDKITVNLKSKYKVIENNADKVSNNTYTWVITRDNYNDKVINISFRTKLGVDTDDPMVRFTIVIVILVILGFIIYLIIKRKFNKSNSL